MDALFSDPTNWLQARNREGREAMIRGSTPPVKLLQQQVLQQVALPEASALRRPPFDEE